MMVIRIIEDDNDKSPLAIDDESLLAQTIAECHQATSRHLNHSICLLQRPMS